MWSVLQSPMGMKLTIVLLHFVWQATLLYCLWRLIKTFASIRSPQHRYGGALGVLILIAACPVLTFVWLDDRQLPVASELESLTGISVDSSSQAFLVDDPDPSLESHGNATTVAAATESRADANWLSGIAYATVVIQPYLMLLWTCGVIVLGLRLCLSYFGTVWLRRFGLTPIESSLLVRYSDLAHQLGLWQMPSVAYSAHIRQAMAVGLLRPMVLLPVAWMTEITPQVLEAVLAHELAHIRRQDLWINFLQRVVETIFFYHPVVWWISSEIRHERELCCDEMAIGVLGQRLSYAQSLEQIAHWQVDHSQASLATPFLGQGQSQLVGRIRQILGAPSAQPGERSWPAGLVLVMIPLVLWVASAIVWSESASPVLADEPDMSETIEEDEFLLPGHLRRRPAHHPPHRRPNAPLGVPPRHEHRPPPHHHMERLLQDLEAALPSSEATDALPREDADVIEAIEELRDEIRLLRDQLTELQHRPPHAPPPPHRHGPPPHDRRPPPHRHPRER